MANLSRASRSSEAALFLTGTALGIFLHPERYTIPSALPFLHLGANVFDPNFKISRLALISAVVGRQTLANLDKENDIRIQNARFYRDSLLPNSRLIIPTATPAGHSVYLRFPVLFKTKEEHEKVLLPLSKERLGSSRSYPTTLDRIPGFQKSLISCSISNANWVAGRILTLPTHRYVREEDRKRIVDLINSVAKAPGSSA